MVVPELVFAFYPVLSDQDSAMSSMDAVALAQDLVRFPSLNPPGDEKACVEYVGRLLRGLGFSVESFDFAPNRPSLVAKMAGTFPDKPLCFTGHLDVVPIGSAPWRYPPFEGVVADGALHGRGSCDMKSGIAAFIAATADLLKQGIRLRRGLTFVITAGEESGCEGAFDLCRRRVLGEAELLVVAEPTSNRPVIAHKGSLRLAVTARGTTAHSSMPEEGDNAISKAVKWISRLQAHSFDCSHPLLGPTTAVVTTITGGQNINSVPDIARFTIDFRTLPEDSHSGLQRELQTMFGEEAEIQVITDFRGFSTPPDSPALRPLIDLLSRRFGRPPRLHGAPYYTDASALVPGFANAPTVVIGPGQSQQCHKTDEHCPVADIETAKEIYSELIHGMCL